MYRDPLAARDKANDGVRRRRLAATRELCQQAIDANDQDSLFRHIAVALPANRQLGKLTLIHRRLAPAHRHLQLAHVQLGARHRNEQIVATSKAQPGRKIVEVGAGLPHSLQFAEDQHAPFGEGVLERQAGEPLSDLEARAMCKQIGQRGVEPVARRSAVFGKNDFDALTGAELSY
jgi:hypothetical protein